MSKKNIICLITFFAFSFFYPHIALSQTTQSSDLNNDGRVDIFDYNMMIGDFGKAGSPGFVTSDINHDGRVDIFDYNILIGDFGKTFSQTPAPTSSPPPTAVCPPNSTCYYVSPNGSDTNNGLSESTPWATFLRAWDSAKSSYLRPGDTLFLMDGTYYQTLQPTIEGQGPQAYNTNNRNSAIKFITIKALHDGKVIINGKDPGTSNPSRQTVVIGETWDNGYNSLSDVNKYGNYINIEGIIAVNSIKDVFEIYAHDVNIRRSSGYNANPHGNRHVFAVWTLGSPSRPSNILLEDNVAAGSGRKMILAYQSYINITFRRNFAAWQYWQGDLFCGGRWPQADGIELYPQAYADQPDVSNNAIFENNINFGLTANHGTGFSPNPGLRAGNKFLGEISLGSGMRWDPTNTNTIKFVPAQFSQNPCSWNNTPLPATCVTQGAQCNDLTNRDYRSGFNIATFSPTTQVLKNNTFKDIFAAYNASVGLATGSWGSCGTANCNNQLINATFINNFIGNPLPLGQPVDTTTADLNRFDTVSNIKVGKIDSGNPSPGNGARLQYRYVDGTLQDGTNGSSVQSLWPWLMEDRIRTEFADPSLFQAGGIAGQVWQNFSVTTNVCKNILVPAGAVSTSACP